MKTKNFWNLGRSHRIKLFIYRWLARRACFPPTVHPQPLVRISPHVIFDCFCESLRVLANIRRVVPCADNSPLGLKTEPVFAGLAVPVNEAGNDGGASVQGESSDSGRRARGNAKKIPKDAFRGLRILVRQNSRPYPWPLKLSASARGLIFVDGSISVRAAVFRDQRIHQRIINRPHQEVQRVPVERLGERRHLPCAHMAREKQHALSLLCADANFQNPR